LNNTREDICETVARLFSVVAAHLEWDGFSKALSDLQKGFKDKTVEYQESIL
jgi:hypothetical protein